MKRSIGNIIVGLILGILITGLFLSKKKNRNEIEINHNMVIERIESLGNLEVVKYNVQDVMEYKKVRQWLPNAKTVMIVSGEIIVCVDLTTLSEDDIYTSGDSIRLSLPNPKLCHVKIDHSRSKILDIEYGLWESAQITDEAYKYVEKELETQSLKLNMEGEGRNNTVNLLTPILKAMGFNYVSITFRESNRTD